MLFDGECGFCDASVRWLLARDRRGRFRFGALQGATAAAVRSRHPELPAADATVLLVEAPASPRERVRTRSDAALRILAELGGPWRLAALARAIPRPLRDAVYRFIAARRTRGFGRLDRCRIPTAAERDRFLDGPDRVDPGGPDNFTGRRT